MRFRMKLSIALICGVIMSYNPAAAQAGSSHTLDQIMFSARERSEVRSMGYILFDVIGPRLTGTRGYDAAAAWLLKRYADFRIDAWRDTVGTWPSWNRGYAHIDLVNPRPRSLRGTLLAWSPGTGGFDVEAEVVLLPLFTDSAEFVRWLPEAHGKFVLMSAPSVTCETAATRRAFASALAASESEIAQYSTRIEWSPKNVRGTGFPFTRSTGALGRRLDIAGVAGIITHTSSRDFNGYQIHETDNTRAVAIALGCEDYGLLLRSANAGAKPVLRVNATAQFDGHRALYNVLATISGSSRSGEFVILSAHLDSWDGASGAVDNGTGTIVVAEAMRILKEVYPRPSRTIMAGHWTGEEQDLIGSRAFTEDHPDWVDRTQALFNVDNLAGRISVVNPSGFPDAAQKLTLWIQHFPPGIADELHIPGDGLPPRGASDDAAFACHGIPAIGLTTIGRSNGGLTWHTDRDTSDHVAFDDLEFNAAVLAMLAFFASEADDQISRSRPSRIGGFAWPHCEIAERVRPQFY